MAVYAVGDIHGHYDEWIELKNKIEKHDPAAMFILVGDIVDRGRKQKEMLDWALENIAEDGKYQMILGNHEDMKLELMQYVMNDPDNYADIIDNYMWFVHMKDRGVTSERIIEYLEWMKKLPLYKDITVNNQRFILVHGGISNISVKNNMITDSINKYVRDDLLWNRDVENNSGLKDTIIIHGHTPTVFEEAFDLDRGKTFNKKDMYGKILYNNNKYNIDCGIAYESKYHRNLAALNLNTLEEVYLYDYSKEGN